MRRSPRNLQIACDHAGLTHFGGIHFFHEFLRVLQFRRMLTRHLTYLRPRNHYSMPQMILALIYPIVLGLDRIEAASFLRANGVFQYLTGLPSFPDPQTLRRFLRQAPQSFHSQLHRLNDRLLQNFIHFPKHRSRLIFDLDSTVLTVFGRQEGAAVGYNPRYRGKRSYDPLLCIEANSAYLWDGQLRPGNAGPWQGSVELLASIFLNVPKDIREVRVRADSGFGFDPVLTLLEEAGTEYAVVARMTAPVKRLLPRLSYQGDQHGWQLAETWYRAKEWPKARRYVAARCWTDKEMDETTLFVHQHYRYRAWVTNLSLSPLGVWRFYDGRAEIEPRIRELREEYALRYIPTRSFAANGLYLEVIRLAYNLVTYFQLTCLPEKWQSFTLQKLRTKLFLTPAELVRPQNRPLLRLSQELAIDNLADGILAKIAQIKPLDL